MSSRILSASLIILQVSTQRYLISKDNSNIKPSCHFPFKYVFSAIQCAYGELVLVNLLKPQHIEDGIFRKGMRHLSLSDVKK